MARKTDRASSGKGFKLWGDDEANVLAGSVSKDTIHGAGGDDTITGLDGDDKLWGDDGNDTLEGGAGKDTLDGGDGDDTLLGGEGRDRLVGGFGADVLTGGADRDRFELGSLASANGDHVTDYDAAGKDRLDIKWDRNLGSDDNALSSKGGDDSVGFSFIGSDAFTAAGQVRVEAVGHDWTVFVNVDADLGADYSFTVTTVSDAALTAKDFHL